MCIISISDCADRKSILFIHVLHSRYSVHSDFTDLSLPLLDPSTEGLLSKFRESHPLSYYLLPTFYLH